MPAMRGDTRGSSRVPGRFYSSSSARAGCLLIDLTFQVSGRAEGESSSRYRQLALFGHSIAISFRWTSAMLSPSPLQPLERVNVIECLRDRQLIRVAQDTRLCLSNVARPVLYG